ncbi:unnamed protein product [Orchesella dallaii]|uniref:Uncharacterized protein n=1 Tax=Orchesella dallaii TaxID=48710 RepID=A0ABP1RBQ0_9HEXA
MDTFLTARLVSQKWKSLADASAKLSFTCKLTDKTLKTVVNSNEKIDYVQISEFDGKGNKVVSSTRGTGRVFRKAQAIHLNGNKINKEELSKMMRYANGAVKNLELNNCEPTLMICVLKQNKSPFLSLNSLTFFFPNYATIRGVTKILQSLDSPTISANYPSLQCFNIIFASDEYDLDPFPSGIELFENYLAVACLLLRLKGTLKSVKIQRNYKIRQALYRGINTAKLELNQQQQNQLEQCLAGFNEIQLECTSLHIDALKYEGTFPWVLETKMVQQQRNLEILSLDKLLCFGFPEPFMALTTSISANTNLNHLTSIHFYYLCSQGTEPVDLAIFSQCPRLTVLELWFFVVVEALPDGKMSRVDFINVDMLPKTLRIFHIKPRDENGRFYSVHYFSSAQIKWIISNLLDLESLELQLLMNSTLMDSDSNQEVDKLSNIDVQTFEELCCLPKLKGRMEFHILKVRKLEDQVEIGKDVDENSNSSVFPFQLMSFREAREFLESLFEQLQYTFMKAEITGFPTRRKEKTVNFINFTFTRA